MSSTDYDTTSGMCSGVLDSEANGIEEHVVRSNVLLEARLLLQLETAPSGMTQVVPYPRGALGNLVARHAPLECPPSGTVLIEVLSVGLNFRDVLNVLGAYPGDPGEPGSDVAGIVSCLPYAHDQDRDASSDLSAQHAGLR